MTEKYKWSKKGSIKIGDETIVPKIGQDVTELVAELDPRVKQSLLNDRRIKSDKNELAEVAEQKRKAAAQYEAAKRAAKILKLEKALPRAKAKVEAAESGKKKDKAEEKLGEIVAELDKLKAEAKKAKA